MKIYILAFLVGVLGNMITFNNESLSIGSIMAIIIIGVHLEKRIDKE